jgi:hypothetical protein
VSFGWDCYCPRGHQLWTSWLGTTGCLAPDCEHRRVTEPGEEIALARHDPPRPCGHPAYVGWGPRYGCRIEGCEHYLPGVDVTKEKERK